MRILPADTSPTTVWQNKVADLIQKKDGISSRLGNFILGAPAGIVSSGYHALSLSKVFVLPMQLICRYGFKSSKLDDFGTKELVSHAAKIFLCVFSAIFTPTLGLVSPKANLALHQLAGLASKNPEEKAKKEKEEAEKAKPVEVPPESSIEKPVEKPIEEPVEEPSGTESKESESKETEEKVPPPKEEVNINPYPDPEIEVKEREKDIDSEGKALEIPPDAMTIEKVKKFKEEEEEKAKEAHSENLSTVFVESLKKYLPPNPDEDDDEEELTFED